jgi:hypothetical protein
VTPAFFSAACCACLPQASHRNACQHALRMTRLRPALVALPDLHAANLFLQGYSTLQIAADGKLPKITSLLHVEAFHMLAQSQEQADKVRRPVLITSGCYLAVWFFHASCTAEEGAGRQGALTGLRSCKLFVCAVFVMMQRARQNQEQADKVR